MLKSRKACAAEAPVQRCHLFCLYVPLQVSATMEAAAPTREIAVVRHDKLPIEGLRVKNTLDALHEKLSSGHDASFITSPLFP